jgi:hypothetical protein
MKSVIALNSFAIAITDSNVRNLNKGEGAFVTSKGVVLNGTTDVLAADEYVQLVVGLGDGGIKRGVVLNPKNTITYGKIAYLPQDDKRIALKIDSVAANNAYTGEEITINLTITPKGIYQGNEDRPYVISISALHGGDTATVAQIAITLASQIQAMINNMQAVFGIVPIYCSFNGTDTFDFRSTIGYNYEVTFEGLGVTATKTVSKIGVYNGIGGGEQVAEMEKVEDVAAIGYNPSFARLNERAYGDIFLADKNKSYNIYIIHSKADQTDVLDTGTQGGIVKQIVAIDTNATATDFETILSLIGQISNDITYI